MCPLHLKPQSSLVEVIGCIMRCVNLAKHLLWGELCTESLLAAGCFCVSAAEAILVVCACIQLILQVNSLGRSDAFGEFGMRNQIKCTISSTSATYGIIGVYSLLRCGLIAAVCLNCLQRLWHEDSYVMSCYLRRP